MTKLKYYDKLKLEVFYMVKLANFWYFFFIMLTACIIVGLYFLFRNKSLKAKKILVGFSF